MIMLGNAGKMGHSVSGSGGDRFFGHSKNDAAFLSWAMCRCRRASSSNPDPPFVSIPVRMIPKAFAPAADALKVRQISHAKPKKRKSSATFLPSRLYI